ncbi:hypothetical protein PVAP13_3KG268427 [Panicum virgatum]|uniref:Uncharacterized protein n=1 Tax=Panicum virgatum TaxID=38727 RepID=A0A8T0V9M3_PANVG|nr:hypothetical protein PVAP13_3KG268427 [Panicum virgatum]
MNCYIASKIKEKDLSEFGCICDAASPSRGAAARPASSARGHNVGSPSLLPPSLRPGARPPPPWQTSSSAVALLDGGSARRRPSARSAPPLPLLPPLPASSVCAAASTPEICRRATPGRRGSLRRRAAPPSRW